MPGSLRRGDAGFAEPGGQMNTTGTGGARHNGQPAMPLATNLKTVNAFSKVSLLITDIC